MEVAQKLRRQTYFDKVIIRHYHCVNGKAIFDILYERNSKYIEEDKVLYHKRNPKPNPKPKITIQTANYKSQITNHERAP